jgi:hypothetical protein
MFRVTLPDAAPASTGANPCIVTSGAVTVGVCAANEIAVFVGDTVPRQRCGSELREFLDTWTETPKDPDAAVGAGNRKVYSAAPGTPGDQVLPVTQAIATAPTETQYGIILGDVAATFLDRSSLLDAAMQRAVSMFVATLGL